jgi:hypothetical protein
VTGFSPSVTDSLDVVPWEQLPARAGAGEVEIARIEIASTTFGVTSLFV